MQGLADICHVEFDVPERYADDPRGRAKPNCGAVAKPATTQEVAKVLAFARAHKISVVPFGGGTGLVGGQFFEGGTPAICLSLEKLRTIEIEDGSALVGAGVVLDEVHSALEGAGSHFPLHLASSGSAQIGGLIATNAGGVNVLRYGSMGALVLGLEAVLADGTVIDTTRDLRKDNTGLQLDRLMIGAEGTLGVITRARLRLFPVDESRAVILAEVTSPDEALALLSKARGLKAELTAFELISGVGLNFRVAAGFADGPIGMPKWSVLVELGGSEAEVEESVEVLAEAFENAVLAQSEAQIEAIWHMRETIPLANRHIGAIASHDISLPLPKQAEFIEEMGAELADDDLRINVFGHLGDGNLHYNLFPAEGREKSDYDGVELSMRVYAKVTAFGGSISAEHGIGRAKAGLMKRFGMGEKQSAMRKIKASLDPDFILNPGVFFSEK